MNQAQMQEALEMMKRAIALMEAAMTPDASEEGTVASTGMTSVR